MKTNNHIAQLRRGVQVRIESIVLPRQNDDEVQGEASPSPTVEATQLAREAIQAFETRMAEYRAASEREKDRLDPRPTWEGQAEAILAKPLDQTTFFDIERLSRDDPERGMKRWREVKAAARSELDSGFIAASAIEPVGGSAWERACFAAIRERLHAEYLPRSPGERAAIDEMAQYEALRLRWLKIAAKIPEEAAIKPALQICSEEQHGDKLRLTIHAMKCAMRTVELMQRLYQNAQRVLLRLRRQRSAKVRATFKTVHVEPAPMPAQVEDKSIHC